MFWRAFIICSLLGRLCLESFLFEKILTFLSKKSFFQILCLNWMININNRLIKRLMNILCILLRLLLWNLLRYFETNHSGWIGILLRLPLFLFLLISFTSRISSIMIRNSSIRSLFLKKLHDITRISQMYWLAFHINSCNLLYLIMNNWISSLCTFILILRGSSWHYFLFQLQYPIDEFIIELTLFV